MVSTDEDTTRKDCNLKFRLRYYSLFIQEHVLKFSMAMQSTTHLFLSYDLDMRRSYGVIFGTREDIHSCYLVL